MREAGINAELYPESGKLKKQLDYANQKNIPYVLLIGSEEMQTGQADAERHDLRVSSKN